MSKVKAESPTIDINIARKVLETIDAGLVHGKGNPIPGQMCVEAAVCYALGLPHGDEPICVSPVLRNLKIRLNDSNWSSNMTRAKGLRRLGLAQLDSRGNLDEKEFSARVQLMTCQTIVADAMDLAAQVSKNEVNKENLTQAAKNCRAATNKNVIEVLRASQKIAYAAYAADAADAAYAAADAAYAAYAAAYAAYADAAADATRNLGKEKRDYILSTFAENVVQILIEMKVPGIQWLSLTEIEVA